jgi:hypothetical protein
MFEKEKLLRKGYEPLRENLKEKYEAIFWAKSYAAEEFDTAIVEDEDDKENPYQVLIREKNVEKRPVRLYTDGYDIWVNTKYNIKSIERMMDYRYENDDSYDLESFANEIGKPFYYEELESHPAK